MRRLPRLSWLLLPLLAPLAAAGAAERGPAHRSMTPSMAELLQPRVIVRFKDDSQGLRSLSAARLAQRGPQQAARLAAQTGLKLTDGRAIDSHTQVLLGDGLSATALARQLMSRPDVAWAVPDRRRFALAAPNDPLYGIKATRSPAAGQWYLRAPTASTWSAINAEGAWSITQGKNSVVVAVLDTGIRAEHPDLAAKLLSGYDFVTNVPMANDGNGRDSDPADPGDWITTAETNAVGGDFYQCGYEQSDGTWVGTDSSWHGTQVAGIIGASTNNGVGMAGTAPNTLLLPVRVLGKCGGYDSDIAAAMRWAAGLSVPGVGTNPHPAKVINLSLGGPDSCSDTLTSAVLYRQTVADVTAAGASIVVAAGNEGDAIGMPANCAGVIAVTGVRATGTKVAYSNAGPQATVAAPAGNCVNSVGECLYPILSTANSGTTSPVSSTYTTGGADAGLGTSFAAPQVSGTVALMLAANPALTPAQVIDAIKATARTFPSSGAGVGVANCQDPAVAGLQDKECYCTTDTCGAGMLDAQAAVAQVVALQPAIAVTPTSPAVGATVNLNASGSLVATGRTISTYAWSLVTGADLAHFDGATNGSTASLVVTAAGTVTVRLTLTDDQGHTASTDTVLTVSAASTSGGGGGGGGAWSAGWLLALLALGGMLRRPPAMR